MADLSQLSDADLIAAYQASQAAQSAPPPIQSMSDADLTAAYRASHPVTATDRAHAAEGGILGGLAYTATAIPDAVANLYGLGKAAVGTGVNLATSGSTEDPLRTPGGLYHFIGPDGQERYSKNSPPAGSKPVQVPQSGTILDPTEAFPAGRWLTGQMDKNELTSTQAPRPDDTASRYLNTAGNVIGGVAGGEPIAALTGAAPSTAGQLARSLAVATPPAIAGRAVAESKPFDEDWKNNAASVLTQAFGTLGAGALMRPKGELLPENQVKNDAVTAGQDAGYQFPPATTNPTGANIARETIAGKSSVADKLSVNNQRVTNEGARADMGLPPGKGGAITDLEIQTAKSNAAPSYDALRGAGTITPPADFHARLDKALSNQSGAGQLSKKLADPELASIVDDLKSKSTFDAGDAMDAISALRDKASAAYRSGNAQAGKAYKGVSKVLEDAIDSDLTSRGGAAADLVNNFKDSRQKFAIINSVEENRNATTGNVLAQKLAAALKKGDYLSGNLQTAGNAAGQAPKAFAEPTKTTGNHLGLLGALVGGGELTRLLPEDMEHAGLATLAGAAAIPAARAGMRAYIAGPGQANALPRTTAPALDPRILAGALAAGAPNTNR